MLKNMQKSDFSVKNSKKFTPIMHFKIQNFGKVLKISEHIVEKFQLLMEIYIPDPKYWPMTTLIFFGNFDI